MSQLKDKKDVNFPLHWTIGKDSINNYTRKSEGMLGEIKAIEKWSDNLLLSDEYMPMTF